MRRYIIIIMIMMLILALAGCKKSPAEDAYDKDAVESPGQEIQEDSGLVDTENKMEESDASDSLEEDTDSEGEQLNEEVVENEETMETPTEDTYPSASEPIAFDYAELEGMEPLEITDPVLIDELESYLYDFYFNYYFQYGLEEETGNVGIDAMTLFALSYIMQYEYNELEFDTDNFTLYIPKEYVVQKVEKVFLRKLDVFKSYEDLGITYLDDKYRVNVEDGVWDVELSVTKVEKLGDFTYRVTADLTGLTSGRVKEEVQAIIDESQNGHVMVNYHIKTIEE